MIRLSRLQAAALAALLALVCTAPPAHTQGKRPEGTVVAQRPFASLSELLGDIDRDFTRLGGLKNRLDRDAGQLEAGRRSLRTDQEQLDRDRKALEARKSAMEVKRKWKCNFKSVLHDKPADCTHPEQGGTWLNVNVDGKEVLGPSKADLDAVKVEETRLAAEQKKLADRQARLDLKDKEYRDELQSYEARTTELSKKLAGLSDPKMVAKEVRANVEKAGGNLTSRKALDKMESFLGKPPGECVSLVREFTGLGPAKDTWTPGDSVKDSALVAFAPAATFVNKRYESLPSGNHAVIVLDKTTDGLLVFDQHAGKAPGIHLIRYRGGRGDAENAARLKKGFEAADKLVEEGKVEAGTREYYQAAWKAGGYNPSNDADNYSYVK